MNEKQFNALMRRKHGKCAIGRNPKLFHIIKHWSDMTCYGGLYRKEAISKLYTIMMRFGKKGFFDEYNELFYLLSVICSEGEAGKVRVH